MVLECGIEAEIPPEGPGRCPATRETIALMIELAYLESKNYHCSLKEWREALERLNVGRLEGSGNDEKIYRGRKGVRELKQKQKSGEAVQARPDRVQRRK